MHQNELENTKSDQLCACFSLKSFENEFLQQTNQYLQKKKKKHSEAADADKMSICFLLSLVRDVSCYQQGLCGYV